MERVKRTHALLGIAIFLLVSIYGATRVYATEGETIIIDMESSTSETIGESTYAESSAAETSNIQESSSTTGETGSKMAFGTTHLLSFMKLVDTFILRKAI